HQAPGKEFAAMRRPAQRTFQWLKDRGFQISDQLRGYQTDSMPNGLLQTAGRSSIWQADDPAESPK
ncbi:hypothetical protein KI387_021934, partial [Taxus chinensis]